MVPHIEVCPAVSVTHHFAIQTMNLAVSNFTRTSEAPREWANLAVSLSVPTQNLRKPRGSAGRLAVVAHVPAPAHRGGPTAYVAETRGAT